MPRLANAGYHVIAPDLRGYGRTDGAGVTFDDDLRPFRMLNEIQDMLALVSALGYQHLHLVGHDFGSGGVVVRGRSSRHLPFGRTDECTICWNGDSPV